MPHLILSVFGKFDQTPNHSGHMTMTKALQNSYRGFSVLFALNWDALLSFGVTALALAGAAYLAGL